MNEEKATTKGQEKTLFGNHFAQVAWVVPDIEKSAKFFSSLFGPGLQEVNYVKTDQFVTLSKEK